MSNIKDQTDIFPVNPADPFNNPTEEPDYSPDYREIVPELAMPDSRLPLFPSNGERSNIRKYFSLTFLTLLFGMLTAMTIFVALQLVSTAFLRQVDLRVLGALPGNYNDIVRQYLNDSSISFAINLIAFLCGNLAAFGVGCKLTGIQPRSMFRLRELSAVRTVSYVFIGLWLQYFCGLLAAQLSDFFSRAGLPLTLPDTSLNDSGKRTAVIVLYVGLVAPITEELLMRGFVLKNLSRISQRFAIVLSALLFGIMHENLVQFLFTFPLGILLGYITIKHNSLTPAIIVHMCVNSAGIAMEFCSTALMQGTFRTVNMVYTLTVILLGSVSLLFLLVTERLPVQTPHQSLRTTRIAISTPLLWFLVALHIASGLLAARA